MTEAILKTLPNWKKRRIFPKNIPIKPFILFFLFNSVILSFVQADFNNKINIFTTNEIDASKNKVINFLA